MEILYFDSTSLTTQHHLTNISKIIGEKTTLPHGENSTPLIIICGAYVNSHHSLLTLAGNANILSLQQIQKELDEIIEEHIRTLHIIFYSHQDNHTFDFMHKQILQFSTELSSLLKGIHLIKETSQNTAQTLYFYASKLSAVLIQAHIFSTYNSLFAIHTFTDSLLNISKDKNQIIPISIPEEKSGKNSETSIDTKIAQHVIDCNARKLNIWTNQSGIMTANPKTIPHAQVISNIDYNTALEICYLGGKILHPDAMHILEQHNIPIAIYTLHSSNTNPISIISSKTSKLHDKSSQTVCCTTITERDKFSILTIKSTNMFHAHGYLEKIFKIFNDYKVSIETVSTSEISVTLTFPSKQYSHELMDILSTLGEIDCMANQTIISLVGVWDNPSSIAKALTALHDIPISMISLGQTTSNLNIVLTNSNKQRAIQALHSCFFETT